MPDQVIALATKQKQQVLYGPAYGGFTKSLKVAATLSYKPEILAVGDSRILQIRKEFFNQDTKFYNAGLAVSNLPDFRTFLNFIPTSTQPKILIVDLNQQAFNETTYVPFDQGGKKLMSPVNFNDQSNIFITNWTHIYKHFLEKKFSLSQVFYKKTPNVHLLGLEALIQLKGFRNDGSYYDGEYVLGRAPMPSEVNFQAAHQWITEGSNVFAYGEKISQPAVDEIAAFLGECHQRGIFVVGLLAPFPHQVYSQIKDSGKYGYFFQVPGTIKPLFDRYNFEFYDFSDLASLGAGDDEVNDAAHASEKAYLRMYLEMLHRGSVLNHYSNEEFLSQTLKASTGSLDVFPDNFADNF